MYSVLILKNLKFLAFCIILYFVLILFIRSLILAGICSVRVVDNVTSYKVLIMVLL